MGQVESAWQHSVGRRNALLALSGLLAGSPLLRAQEEFSPIRNHRRALGIDEMVTLWDFEPIFFSNVPLTAFDFITHGSDGEWTKARNRDAFGWVDIAPRPAIDVNAVDTSTELFGQKLDNPFFIAPSGNQASTHPDAEIGMYVGGSAGKTLTVLPSGGKYTPDKIAATAKGPMWYQFYPNQDVKRSRETLDRQQAAGAHAIIVTLDQKVHWYDRTEEDINLGGKPLDEEPLLATADNPYRVKCCLERWWYSWSYLDEIRPFIKVPMVGKGVMTAEDAELCIQHGCDGIIVSNHGGRSVDYLPSALEVLPEILAAVRGRVPVLTDSGYRGGADVLKGLALGAKAVGLGRPPRWALGAYGGPGVQRMCEILHQELVLAMAKAGRPTVASLDHTAVRTHFV